MRDERGVALVLAVFVLTVIGALVAAAFFAGTQEQRMAEFGRRLQRAEGAAESGIAEVMRQWPDTAVSAGTGAYTAVVHRLSPDLLLLDVVGRDRHDLARVRLGLLVRAPVPCDSTVVEGLELSQSKCHIDKSFQKTSGAIALRSRAWIQLVQGS